MASTATKVYKYDSLPSTKCIRLLRIQSESEDPIDCTLELADLTSGARPSYDCLSYTWGDPLYENLLKPEAKKNMTDKPSRSIKCDGIAFPVTQNLHEALKQLSKGRLEITDVERNWKRQSLLWIDAICIDQENAEEKGDQVDMMAEIYRDAQNVIVWLGPNDSLTDRGIEVMQHLASVLESRYDAGIPSDLEDREGLKKLGLPYIPPRGWLALGTFFLRSWFSRIWVLQETFAAENPVVICGTHTLDWRKITAASQTLGSTRLGRLLIKEIEGADDTGMDKTRYVANKINNQSIFGDITRENASFLNLETLLAYSRYFGATKDQDRVYAVRGMWKHSPVHETEAFNSLKSNYNLSVHNVYTTASIATILEMDDLNILSLVEDFSFRSENLKDLPSWVPDYSVTPVSEPLDGNPRPVEGTGRWNASAGLKWEAPPLMDLLPLPTISPRLYVMPVLLVQGNCFDSVVEFAASDSEITDDFRMYSLLHILRKVLDSETSYEVETLVEAFWRSLIKDTFREKPAEKKTGEVIRVLFVMWVWEMENAMGMHGLEDDVDESKIESIKDGYTESKTLFNYLSGRDEGGIIPSWETIRAIIELGIDEYEGELPAYLTADYEDISDSFRAAYVGRRLFRTQDNHLGIGPQSLQEGDEIWVLARAAVPMVLRPLGNEKWHLVGEAYVHGIMKGEIVGLRGKVADIDSETLW